MIILPITHLYLEAFPLRHSKPTTRLLHVRQHRDAGNHPSLLVVEQQLPRSRWYFHEKSSIGGIENTRRGSDLRGQFLGFFRHISIKAAPSSPRVSTKRVTQNGRAHREMTGKRIAI